MIKFAGIAAAAMGLILASFWQKRDAVREAREACILRCVTEPADPELNRQEIVSLEREAARAIQLNNGTFFRRVYSEDFSGTLSRGQQVNKAQWIAVIQSDAVKYESFNTSDIKVQLYQDMAIATCLWSSRSIIKGQHISHQMRVIHVYLNGASGWHVVSGQITSLPPDVQQPL
jgi:Domain of unknown function (DUF4440)